MLDQLAKFFALSVRYRKAGKDNPLIRKVALNEMNDLYGATRSDRLKIAINKFLCEAKPHRGVG